MTLSHADTRWGDAILFCGRDKLQYPWLSNFYMHGMTDPNGKVWPSVEHLYQSLKFDDEALREEVRKVKTPKQSKELAHLLMPANGKKDWHKIKVGVMRTCLELKFKDPDMRKLLRETGSKYLVEHAYWDSFWGCGRNMDGENWMGRLLMQVRAEVADD